MSAPGSRRFGVASSAMRFSCIANSRVRITAASATRIFSVDCLDLGQSRFRRQRAQSAPIVKQVKREVSMAETTKLSVEKALEKLRGSDELKSKSARLDETIDELDEEIKRMRAQRLRLERHQRRSIKPD
jgi:hypothetical protein